MVLYSGPALFGSSIEVWGGEASPPSVRDLKIEHDMFDYNHGRTNGGAELDLRLEANGRVIGFEIKRTDRPSTTKSMHVASADLELDHLFVVHGGQHRFALAEGITAIGVTELLTAASPLAGIGTGSGDSQPPNIA